MSLINLYELFPKKATLWTVANCAQREFLCGGQLKTWDGASYEVTSPISMQRASADSSPSVFLDKVSLGSYPMMDSNAALEVLEEAKRAYNRGLGHWPSATLEERICCILKFTDLMKAQRESIVEMLCLEICKPLKDACAEFDRTIKYIYDTVEAVKQTDQNDSRFISTEGVTAQIRRSPLGIALCMGPYNYPLNETFTTLIPALIMGNVVIMKPPRLGVLLLDPLMPCFKKAFPPGVVGTIYGDGQTVVKPIMQEGSINILNFIGSKKAAKAIIDYHPDKNRLLCVLGLQAKNAGIILPCADLDLAVKECVSGSLKFNGQRCTALKLIFVHRKIADDFTEKFCAAVDKLKIGMPWDDGVSITPLADGDNAVSYLSELINDACGKGATIKNNNGGQCKDSLMTPTVVAWADPSMRIWKEEQFGPVVPIARFGMNEKLDRYFGTNFEEIVNYHVESGYGQQVSIFGNDSNEIAQLIDLLSNQVSRININCECQRGPDVLPFTGRKDSATGTLSVSDAPKVMSIRRVISTKTTDANNNVFRDIVRRRLSKSFSTDWLF